MDVNESAEWVPAREAVARLGRSRARVYEWLKRPETDTGIVRKIEGGRTLVRFDTIQAYADSRITGRPPQNRRTPSDHDHLTD